MGGRLVRFIHALNRTSSSESNLAAQKLGMKAKIELMREVMADPDAAVSDLSVAAYWGLREGPDMIKALSQYEDTSLEERLPPHLTEFVSTATELCEMMSKLASERLDEAVTGQMVDNLVQVKQEIGKAGLFLSGGATFGMAHIGIVKCLFEHGALPQVITGASAGSIVAAMVCTKTDEEIPELLKTFHEGSFAVFDRHDANKSWWRSMYEIVSRLKQTGYLLESRYLKEEMKARLGDITFAEAHRRTKRVLNISVSYEMMWERDHLLNYMTSPHVTIASAVTASCSLPYVFQPSPLCWRNPATGKVEPCKDITEVFVDGSIHGDLPMRMVRQHFGVTDAIVSQANPHINIFGEEEWEKVESETGIQKMVYGNSEEDHWIVQAAEEQVDNLGTGLATVLSKGISILVQEYIGDVTMRPMMPLDAHSRLLSNPDANFMQMACLVGERAVWPKLARIKASLAIERALEESLRALRTNNFQFHEAEAAKRREEIFEGPKKRPRRHSGGAIDLGKDALRPLTAANPAISAQHGARPALKRAPHSQQFPVVPGMSAIPATRPKGRILPPLTIITPARLELPHTGQFNAAGVSIPLSPLETQLSLLKKQPDAADPNKRSHDSAITMESKREKGKDRRKEDGDEECIYLHLQKTKSRQGHTKRRRVSEESKTGGNDD